MASGEIWQVCPNEYGKEFGWRRDELIILIWQEWWAVMHMYWSCCLCKFRCCPWPRSLALMFLSTPRSNDTYTVVPFTPCMGYVTHNYMQYLNYISHHTCHVLIHIHIQALGTLLCVSFTSQTLTLFWWLMLAPPSINILTTSLWPLSEDIASGVSIFPYIRQMEKTLLYISSLSPLLQSVCVHTLHSLTHTHPSIHHIP